MRSKTKKLIWLAPIAAVIAAIGALAIFAVQMPGGVAADELPDNPQNLKVKAADGNAGRTTLVLTWEAPANGATPTGYRIDVSTNNEKYKQLAEVSGSTLTYSHEVRPRGMDRMATAGWERFYRVYAMNSHGYGGVSTAESATTKALAVPGEATQVKVASSDPEMVDLTWTVPDDGGSDILGYCIRVWPTGTSGTVPDVSNTNCLSLFSSDGPGGEAGDYRNTADNSNDQIGDVIRIEPAASYTHKKLRAKQNWTYEVYAFNRYGNSKTSSGEYSATTAAADDPTAPAHLLALQADSDSSSIVELYWTAPDDGGQDVSSYRIEVSNKKNYWPSTGFNTNQQLSGSGSKESSTDITTDSGDPATTKALVHVVTLAANTQDSTDPYQFQHTVDARTGTLYYRVKTITGSGASQKESSFKSTSIKLVDDDTSSADSVQFTEPIPAPVIGADAATGSDTTGATTASDDENGTDDTSATDDDNDLKPGVIKLLVTPPDSDPTTDGNQPLAGANSYRVDVSTDVGKTWTTVHTATRPINGNEYEHEGLDPEKRLHFRFFAKKGSDYGHASVVIQDYAGNTDMPSKVQDLVAVKAGAGSINLSWKAPASNGGAAVEQYCIVVNQIDDDDDVQGTAETRNTIAVQGTSAECTRLGEPAIMPIIVTGTNHVFQVDGDTMAATFVGLMEKTRWQFEVFALNEASDSDINNNGNSTDDNEANGLHALSLTSDKAKAKTGAATVPGMPQRLSAQLARDTNEVTGIGKQGVLLLWNPPADPPGAPVKTYKIERKIDGGEYKVRASSHAAGTTHWVDPTEPKAGEIFTYRMTAINDVDPGTEMATVMLPRPAAGHSHVAPSGSIMAQTVAAGASLDAMDVSGYFSDNTGATYSATSSDDTIADATVSGSMVTIMGKAVGTATITVTADVSGYKATQEIAVTVSPAAVTAPTNVTATNTGLEVTVNWEGGDNATKGIVALVTRKADGAWDIDNAVYDPTDGTSPFKVNMSTRPAGTYTVLVLVGDDSGNWSAWISGSLDYQP